MKGRYYETRRCEKKFREANDLFKQGKNKKEISELLGVSRPTIIKWLSSETYQDHRGWKNNKLRKEENNQMVAERICALKQKRIDHKYFVGSAYVQMDYARKYPDDSLPSVWFIDETVRKNKKQTRMPKKEKRAGGSKYLLFPTESIKRLGHIHQSADFIGRKYIAGRTEPINIFSNAYYTPFKLYQIKRVVAEKAAYALDVLKEQWEIFPIPDVFRIDNGLQFRGSASGKRSVGLFLRFLLNLGITPLFGSPSTPWTNPHIEGHNRVFSEKVWGRNHFSSLTQIDNECERFNRESKDYFKFRYANYVAGSSFRFLKEDQVSEANRLISTKGKKIYFIRFVESHELSRAAHVYILNERISVPEQYTHQFVFVEWDIEKELLSIYSEYDKNVTLVKQMGFPMNTRV